MRRIGQWKRELVGGARPETIWGKKVGDCQERLTGKDRRKVGERSLAYRDVAKD